jgi:hypothetical protein
MRKLIVLTAGAVAVATLTVASPAGAARPTCNWGQLTSGAIHGGFDQGSHASDPSGDGHGPEDRVGLANVIEPGNLHATCEFLAGQ